MTFFDKFFSIRSRTNRTENELKVPFEPLSFSPSPFEFTKDQIRVVLFRECDRRGRKLLFDSNAVEKLPANLGVNSKNPLDKKKCSQAENSKLSQNAEVTNPHGFKFKKPSNDITLLGEMIFGSVALVFKCGNTFKVHTLPSPKSVVFTNIVHAPGQCHNQLTSHYIDSSSTSDSGNFSGYVDETRTSSSDSKLYKHKQSCKPNVSTYPCIKHKNLQMKKSACSCQVNNDPSNTKCSENISIKNKSEGNSFSEGNNVFPKDNGNCKRLSDYGELSLHCFDQMPPNKQKCDSSTISNTPKNLDEYSEDVISSFNNLDSSLGSLRRRWMQSCFSSIDGINYEDKDKPKNKARIKLGMGLLVDLSKSVEDELEKFLFNHTIIIESIIKRLQSSIETAYIKKENFIDLTYAAFINCQQSMYELITGGRYAKAMWLTLAGKPKEQSEPNTQNKSVSQNKQNVKERKTQETLSSVKDRKKQETLSNVKDHKTQDAVSNVQVKFLNDFCDVLVKFDTKDTNFFISTLLTAVLTHHLSWVTGIAESDVTLPQHNLSSAVKNLHSYNPIWAQLNDLNGMLGSPLQSARTIVTGPQSSRNNIAAVVEVLTYFIRCYDVVETVYDFDIESLSIVNQGEEGKLQESVNLYCGAVSSNKDYSSQVLTAEQDSKMKISRNKDNGQQMEVSGVGIPIAEHRNENFLRTNDNSKKMCTPDGMKKSKSCLFRREDDRPGTFGPDVENFVQMESSRTRESYDNRNKNNTRDTTLDRSDQNKKMSNLARFPNKTMLTHLEQGFDCAKDCDIVGSSTVINKGISDGAKSARSKDDVLFVIGENDELINLKKTVTPESGNKDSRKELSSSIEPKNISQSESVSDILPAAEDSKKNLISNSQKGVTAERTVNDDGANFQDIKSEEADDEDSFMSIFPVLPMPKCSKKYTKKRLEVCSVLGSVNDSYNSEHIVQGVLEDRSKWEKILREDLMLCAHDNVLDRNVTEALCIIGDMNSWEVSLISSSKFTLDKRGFSGIRIGMSQIVSNMLESLLCICKIKLPPDICLNHIEKRLHEIYTKSKCVAELLNTTEMCTIEYLTSRLDIGVNDVPLLLSVATTHSPHISSKYGLTYT